MYKNNHQQQSIIAYEIYKEIRNRINNKIKMIKAEYWEKYSSDMQQDGAQRKIWKLLKFRKKPVNKTARINNISEEEWRTYFENLYRVEQIDNDNNIKRTNEERIMELQKGITFNGIGSAVNH